MGVGNEFIVRRLVSNLWPPGRCGAVVGAVGWGTAGVCAAEACVLRCGKGMTDACIERRLVSYLWPPGRCGAGVGAVWGRVVASGVPLPLNYSLLDSLNTFPYPCFEFKYKHRHPGVQAPRGRLWRPPTAHLRHPHSLKTSHFAFWNLHLNHDSNADNPEFKRRVVASGVLLVAAKLLNVSIPIILKTAVDAMTGEVSQGACVCGVCVCVLKEDDQLPLSC